MTRTVGSTRFMISLWIVAGLVVAGINGGIGLFLLDAPLSGYSDGVRAIDRGLREYRQRRALASQTVSNAMSALRTRFVQSPLPSTESAARPPLPTVSPPEPAPKRPPRVELPVLSGVLTRRTADGEVRRRAILDGRLYAEGDRIGDLTLKTISIRGVTLVRGGRQWLLDAPDTPYSLNNH